MTDYSVPLLLIVAIETLAFAWVWATWRTAIAEAVEKRTNELVDEWSPKIDRERELASSAAASTEQLARENAALRARLSPAKVHATRAEYDAMIKARCDFCGFFHGNIACPRVKTVAYRDDKSVASVEYWKSWDTTQVIVIEDVVVDEGLSEEAKAAEPAEGPAQRP